MNLATVLPATKKFRSARLLWRPQVYLIRKFLYRTLVSDFESEGLTPEVETFTQIFDQKFRYQFRETAFRWTAVIYRQGDSLTLARSMASAS